MSSPILLPASIDIISSCSFSFPLPGHQIHKEEPVWIILIHDMYMFSTQSTASGVSKANMINLRKLSTHNGVIIEKLQPTTDT